MVNFSAIPKVKDSGGPWDSLKLAAAITFSLLSIMALGAVITAFTGHRDTVMTLISGFTFLGFIGLVIRGLIRAFLGYKKQQLSMQEFAKDNNWQYNGSERTVADLVPYPPSYSGLVSSWNKVRCTVSGELNGRRFELAHITYMQSAGLLGALSDNTGRGRYAGTSVLRVEGHPELQKKPNLIYEKDISYTYIICRYNALYSKDIQAMFASVG